MILSASMMCGNYDALKDDVIALSDAGIDMFHIDIMDGNFVPNFAMGRQDIAAIRKHSSKPLDAHLMVSNPRNYLDILIEEGVDIIYVHPETDNRIIDSLNYLRSRHVAPGIAVSPQFSFATMQDILPYVDYVLMMTVVPGFAGQSFLEHTQAKIEAFIQGKQTYSYRVMMDGAVSPEILTRFHQKGVDGFILGTSSLFQAGKDYAETIKKLRQGSKDEN